MLQRSNPPIDGSGIDWGNIAVPALLVRFTTGEMPLLPVAEIKRHRYSIDEVEVNLPEKRGRKRGTYVGIPVPAGTK